MTRVIITQSKLDDLADSIAAKSGETAPMTLAEMKDAVDGIAPNLQSKTGITPTTSSQTIQADSGYDGLSSVQIDAISPVRSSSDLTASGATVTAPAGYYASNASKAIANGSASASASKSISGHTATVTPSVTKTAGYITSGSANGTAVTVSASELVSGTYSVTSSGTKDVTNYASASVPSLTLPTTASSTYSGEQVAIIQPSSSRRYLNIPTGYNDTASNYVLAPTMLDSKTITTNGTYIASDEDLHGYSSVTVNVSGGGSSDVQVGSASKYGSTSSTLLFNNLLGEPTSFSIVCGTDGVSPSSTSQPVAFVYDGTNRRMQTITNTSNAQVTYVDAGFTFSYSGGMLTVSVDSGTYSIPDEAFLLLYTYGGTAGNIQTEDVQVGSGATSITFTGLGDEPVCWSCVFKSNFSTSSGYQRVIAVQTDGNDIAGLEMDSSAKTSLAHWSYSYSNGSLTITSQGTNAGGYFHQPGYYQLTYAVSGDQSLQTKTVTPTTSTQNVTADTGYTALKKVVVNPIPSSYVQPTTTVGATTYRASTSSQTISAGTYHSAAATIAAVTQTNLDAANIKSGTTVTISNGQSNLWSVTGTYTGGGGGSASVASTTWTNSSNTATSHQFTGLSGTPKAAFLRCTSSLSRSSSSSNYFIADMVWDGSTCKGNSFRRSNGTYANVTSGYSVTTGTNSITFASSGTSTTNPGSFYNGTYELTYVY